MFSHIKIEIFIISADPILCKMLQALKLRGQIANFAMVHEWRQFTVMQIQRCCSALSVDLDRMFINVVTSFQHTIKSTFFVNF